MKNELFTKNSNNSRTSKARKILNNETDTLTVLKYIAYDTNVHRVSEKIRQKAKEKLAIIK